MIVPVKETNALLKAKHYLGPTKTAKFAWLDEYGAAVFSGPRSRRLPPDWLELVRWCLLGEPNAGSRQWRDMIEHLKRSHPNCTTIISYSDPSQGHTGALYRACNWLWAPTWLRLRTPPTGNGNWGTDKVQATKDRWVYLISPDSRREKLLFLNDESLMRRMPWASYREPTWKRGRFDVRSGGGDYKRWLALVAPETETKPTQTDLFATV